MADDKGPILTPDEDETLQKLKYVFRSFNGVADTETAAKLTAVWAATTMDVDLSAFGLD